MHDVLWQGAALFGMVLIAAFFVLEVRRWSVLEPVIGGKQRTIRILLFAIIEALLAMMVLGPWITSRKDPVGALIFWSISVVLLLAVVVLSFIELGHVLKGYVRVNRDLFRNLAEGDKDERERR